MKLIFATNNKHKLEEIRCMLQHSNIEIMSLQDIGCCDEIPETSHTLEGNALQKAEFIYDRYKLNCFADDTGLEVDALNGEPGVYSARYAGKACSFEDNINKLLLNMLQATNRKASFKTVIALIIDGVQHLFTGEVAGEVLTERKGTNGFGYDPVFKPLGHELSFAEMDAVTKNGLSHRFLATKKLIEFLFEKKEDK